MKTVEETTYSRERKHLFSRLKHCYLELDMKTNLTSYFKYNNKSLINKIRELEEEIEDMNCERNDELRYCGA